MNDSENVPVSMPTLTPIPPTPQPMSTPLPNPVPTPSPLPPKPKRVKLSPSTKAGLLIFLLASAVTLTVFPNLSHSPNSPPFGLFLGAGLLMIAYTSLLFLYLNKLNLGFGKSALVLAFGFNVVVIIIKVVLSPYALYLSNRHAAFEDIAGSPNSAWYYIPVAAVVLLLYIIVFRIIYKHFVKRAARRNNLANTKVKSARTARRSFFIFAAIIGFILLGGGALILVPLFFLSPSIDYLNYVFGALALPILVAIILGVFLAYRGFAAVEQQVIITGNSTLLASFFWLGISLIVLYHIMWIIFMLTLVHLWPFNTYTPK